MRQNVTQTFHFEVPQLTLNFSEPECESLLLIGFAVCSCVLLSVIEGAMVSTKNEISVPINRVYVFQKAKQIRESIRKLLDDASITRWVIVAFVGSGAEQYLPQPKGINLICWDKEGCTSPDAIRALRRQGVAVYFAQNLHMKIYYGQGRGISIGSANLSANGMGDDGLHEAVAFLPTNALDVDSVVKSLKAKPVTPQMLKSLDERTRRFRARNKGQLVFPEKTKQGPKPLFSDWYQNTDRENWKLYVYRRTLKGLTKEAQSKLAQEGYKKWVNIWTGKPLHTREDDLILSVDTRRSGLIDWMFCHFSVPIKKSDKGFYEKNSPNLHLAVQCFKTSVYGNVPFNAGEARFQNAIRKLLKQHHVKTYDEGLTFAPNGIVSESKLKRLFEIYKGEA